MASTQTKLMTFAEFADLPDPAGGRYELYHGELIVVADPKFPHVRAQWQLRHLLEEAAGGAGVADKDFRVRVLACGRRVHRAGPVGLRRRLLYGRA